MKNILLTVLTGMTLATASMAVNATEYEHPPKHDAHEGCGVPHHYADHGDGYWHWHDRYGYDVTGSDRNPDCPIGYDDHDKKGYDHHDKKGHDGYDKKGYDHHDKKGHDGYDKKANNAS